MFIIFGVPNCVLQRWKSTTSIVLLPLANGQLLRLGVGPRRQETLGPQEPDKIKDYGHYVLEAGVTYAILLRLCKTPSRQRILSLAKMICLQIQAKNPKAHYARELLRMLVVQQSLLSQRKAHQVLQACFVNTQGKFDSHIPANQRMEWIVKVCHATVMKYSFSS